MRLFLSVDSRTGAVTHACCASRGGVSVIVPRAAKRLGSVDTCAQDCPDDRPAKVLLPALTQSAASTPRGGEGNPRQHARKTALGESEHSAGRGFESPDVGRVVTGTEAQSSVVGTLSRRRSDRSKARPSAAFGGGERLRGRVFGSLSRTGGTVRATVALARDAPRRIGVDPLSACFHAVGGVLAGGYESPPSGPWPRDPSVSTTSGSVVRNLSVSTRTGACDGRPPGVGVSLPWWLSSIRRADRSSHDRGVRTDGSTPSDGLRAECGDRVVRTVEAHAGQPDVDPRKGVQ